MHGECVHVYLMEQRSSIARIQQKRVCVRETWIIVVAVLVADLSRIIRLLRARRLLQPTHHNQQ
jgi:hypothetical protein